MTENPVVVFIFFLNILSKSWAQATLVSILGLSTVTPMVVGRGVQSLQCPSLPVHTGAWLSFDRGEDCELEMLFLWFSSPGSNLEAIIGTVSE